MTANGEVKLLRSSAVSTQNQSTARSTAITAPPAAIVITIIWYVPTFESMTLQPSDPSKKRSAVRSAQRGGGVNGGGDDGG